MVQLVAKTYAQSLFEVGLELETLDSFKEQLGTLVNLLEENADFMELFKTPKISTDAKKKIIEEIFKDTFSSEFLNFLRILFDKGRATHIVEIKQHFDSMLKKHMNIEVAEVISAVKLSDDEKEKLKEKLEKLTGKTIELKTSVTPEIIGGLFIKIGDKVIDSSIKSKLENIKENLRHSVV